MKPEILISIVWSSATLCLGTFFGVLRSKIFSAKTKTNLHFFFYVLAIAAFILSLIALPSLWKEDNLYGIIGAIMGLISSIGLFILTVKYMQIKDVYHTSELDSIVNSFTGDADKDEIKLFGGDLNFFGNSASDMDTNTQYTFLKSMNFNRVCILCEEPEDGSKKLRYGKILHDFPNIQFGFYNPKEADLKVRGRIITVQGVSRLLMYERVKAKQYRALKTDTAGTDGALYHNIWKLVWSQATKPALSQIGEYKKAFLGK